MFSSPPPSSFTSAGAAAATGGSSSSSSGNPVLLVWNRGGGGGTTAAAAASAVSIGTTTTTAATFVDSASYRAKSPYETTTSMQEEQEDYTSYYISNNRNMGGEGGEDDDQDVFFGGGSSSSSSGNRRMMMQKKKNTKKRRRRLIDHRVFLIQTNEILMFHETEKTKIRARGFLDRAVDTFFDFTNDGLVFCVLGYLVLFFLLAGAWALFWQIDWIRVHFRAYDFTAAFLPLNYLMALILGDTVKEAKNTMATVSEQYIRLVYSIRKVGRTVQRAVLDFIENQQLHYQDDQKQQQQWQQQQQQYRMISDAIRVGLLTAMYHCSGCFGSLRIRLDKDYLVHRLYLGCHILSAFQAIHPSKRNRLYTMPLHQLVETIYITPTVSASMHRPHQMQYIEYRSRQKKEEQRRGGGFKLQQQPQEQHQHMVAEDHAVLLGELPVNSAPEDQHYHYHFQGPSSFSSPFVGQSNGSSSSNISGTRESHHRSGGAGGGSGSSVSFSPLGAGMLRIDVERTCGCGPGHLTCPAMTRVGPGAIFCPIHNRHHTVPPTTITVGRTATIIASIDVVDRALAFIEDISQCVVSPGEMGKISSDIADAQKALTDINVKFFSQAPPAYTKIFFFILIFYLVIVVPLQALSSTTAYWGLFIIPIVIGIFSLPMIVRRWYGDPFNGSKFVTEDFLIDERDNICDEIHLLFETDTTKTTTAAAFDATTTK